MSNANTEPVCLEIGPVCRKSCFTAPLTRRCKTKFPTVYPTIYLLKWKFWIQLSPNCSYKRRIDANWSVPTTFLIQIHLIVDEGRELLAGHHRPASERPFDCAALNARLVAFWVLGVPGHPIVLWFYRVCFFVWFDSLRPISNLSVKQGRVFLELNQY